ncbi:hypothetical protein [Alkalibacterium psychrotolerans]
MLSLVDVLSYEKLQVKKDAYGKYPYTSHNLMQYQQIFIYGW